VVQEIRRIVGTKDTYLTFDLDALDPAYAPGIGSPEIGGYSTRDAQVMLRGLDGLAIVGADVNELAPPLDPTGNTAIVAANLMFEILCLIAANRAKAL
jgi:guanidinopropionase